LNPHSSAAPRVNLAVTGRGARAPRVDCLKLLSGILHELCAYRDAGVPVVCPHGLRGTHATLAEEAGEAGAAVARQLGHTDHKVTEGHGTRDGRAGEGEACVQGVAGWKVSARMGNGVSENRSPPGFGRKLSKSSVELMGIEPTASRVRFPALTSNYK